MNDLSAVTATSTSSGQRLTSAALFSLDWRGVILSVTQNASSCWLIEPSQFVGKSFASLFVFGNSPAKQEEEQWESLLAAALGHTHKATASLPRGARLEVSVRIEESTGSDAKYFASVEDSARPQAAPPLVLDSGLALLSSRGSVGFFDLNFKDGLIYYSPGWKRLFGYEDAELVNTYDSWLRLIHPEDSSAAPDQATARKTGGSTQNFSIEIRMRHRRGHYVWVHCLGAQVFGPGGELERVTGLQIDISERKEIEDQAIASEERLRRLSSEGSLAVFDLDLARSSCWFSPTLRRLTGLSDEAPANLETLLALLPEDAAAGGVQAFFLNRDSSQTTYVEVVKLRTQDGRTLPVVLGAHRQISRKRELARVVGFCCPLPENFEGAHPSPIPVPLLEGVLGNLNEAILVADGKGRVLYASLKAQSLTGRTPASVRNVMLGDVFALIDRKTSQPAENALDLALASPDWPKLCSDHALVSKDGQQVPVVWSISQLWTPEGAMGGVVVVFRNPTEMTLTPEELIKTNRLESLGVVAGGIAHDFNNLLTTILGGISHAKDNGDSSFLPDSERACLAAKALTKQLLSAARGSEAAPARVVSPGELLRDANRLARVGSNAEVKFDVGDNVPPVRVDHAQMLQVFQNLIINAVQALPANGGVIQLCASAVTLKEDAVSPLPAGEYVQFEVADNGCGIPPENCEKIFQPFFTTKKHGTGIGLSTVLNIVRKHGGQILVESTVGQGTVFGVFLPVASEPVDVEARPAPALRFGTGRILLMDDDPDICHLVGGMLEGLEYKYDTARNGEEAIALYKRYLNIGRPYDFVILDLTVIGGMGGEETFHELRNLDPDVRAIVASGYDSDDMARRFFDLGFCGYLPKPFRIGDLGRMLKSASG